MDNQKFMCYITYAVPSDKMMPVLPVLREEKTEIEEEFVPQWFNSGGFPEDDMEGDV